MEAAKLWALWICIALLHACAELCLNIKTGTLNKGITDQSVQEAVMKFPTPNPNMADLICNECSNESWQGIITCLWPNTKYIDVTVTGAMAQYIPTLDYYSGGLPLVCTTRHDDAPTSINEQEQQELVELVDMKLEHEYELVVTTYAGLYRYKVGDVLKVAGFKNNAPQITFVRRKNMVLSIEVDNTDEAELHNAIANSLKHLEPFGAKLVEYTSYADTSAIPGHYVLFWELHFGSRAVPKSVLEDCCLNVEESLNSVYRQGRVLDKSIGPLEIRVVDFGTFDQLMDYALSKGASINQYKTPRCIKFAPHLDLLNSRVTKSHFSPNYPKWVPHLKQWENITEA